MRATRGHARAEGLRPQARSRHRALCPPYDRRLPTDKVSAMARSPGPAERRAPVVDGRYLRAVRLARGWTQKQLAAKVGLTQGAISQIELARNRNSQHILLIMYV